MTALQTPPATRTGLVSSMGPLLAVAVVVDLALLGVASLLGAALTVDNAGTLMGVGVVEVVAASILPLSLAAVAHHVVAPRSALVRRLWTPTIAALTVLSLGGLLGASDLTTGLTLGTMHLVVGTLAAFGVPARHGR